VKDADGDESSDLDDEEEDLFEMDEDRWVCWGGLSRAK
jgi:hypothetical protein